VPTRFWPSGWRYSTAGVPLGGPYLEAAIIATGMGVLSWVFLMNPHVEDQALTVIERSISIAYPDHERAVSRGSILRKAGAALVAALDREGIYGPALDAILKLLGDTSETRAGVSCWPWLLVQRSARTRAAG
jgi:hypothetical protein